MGTVNARPSGPIPSNVRVYRARRTMSWRAIWTVGALLVLLAVAFTIFILSWGGT